MNFKNDFADILFQALDGQLEKNKLLLMIEKPKFENMGDMAFPCFELAKTLRRPPHNIAAELASKIQYPLFEKVESVNGYVNVFLNKQKVSSIVIKKVLSDKNHYGDLNIGNDQVITIDFSSPNIAKPFSMGHLRSTVIGNALALISEKCGYRSIRINHLGDWGTQFGKLIVAYKKWGREEDVKQQPIKELLKLYVKFHDESEKDSQLVDDARLWFKKLEDGDEEATKLWVWFREESLKEFSRIYELMGIQFDSYQGEAFYNDKMDRVVQILGEMNLLEESEGAQIVPLDELPPCLIKKSDGTTLYATRDLAAAIYRQETYQFIQSLYVVGNEQTLHFKQLFAVLEKMGYKWQQGMKHVPFGMMLKDGKKMSTRKGKVVLLEEVLNDAISLALKEIEKKNPKLTSKEKVACQVGTGAVIFHDLKNYRQNDIEFSLKEMLKFEGETGPYVQYTYARASSLLRKGKFVESNQVVQIQDVEAWSIVTTLTSFPNIIKRAIEEYDPSQIAKYVIELAREFNKYYASVRIIDDNVLKQDRLSLVYAVTIVLKEGLRLLGLQAPEEM
ncbi:arginine--tRNA ligase [Robertmurraya andreesenii]|uniref:Arginine--tRNA ligase n=1 Tax=Anoxybacillus andreesenii TaxID=1325932 RepID=A0ABT9V9I1_9BACL|nr:arginine--tRNA ligase [Robertmurraya andreesenii]MDQ0157616.1 arginyl-tRNA synthetase [Robertmurraya andreesenii]